METILLVDDEQAVLDGQEKLLKLNGYSSLRTAGDTATARRILEEEEIALAILDLTLKEESGLDLLRWVGEKSPGTVVLVVTGASDLKTAVECMRAGAHDFLVKGSDTGRFPSTVRNALEHRNVLRENARLREALISPGLKNPSAFRGFVTASDQMKRLFHYLEAVAPFSDPILITGETGVGKEIIARAIHESSGLDGPFIPVNLGGLDDQIVADTLFGHTRGAYTGAEAAREGLIRSAAGGTLFLDEFGELSQEGQTKLLRLLDSGEYMPLGSDKTQKSQARLVLATNRDLRGEVAQGKFRQDLYYRISPHEVRVPPLRERPEDIEPILRHLLALHADRLGRPPLEPEALLLRRLRERSLAGNVRELEQLVLSALIHGAWDGLRESKEAPQQPLPAVEAADSRAEAPEVTFGPNLPTPSRAVEELLREAVRRHPENRSEAAGAIGLSPQAFANRWRRMVENGDGPLE
ncbi:MAG: sigma-54-dependent transcriptional regulator [Spirochaetaceae bacterium]